MASIGGILNPNVQNTLGELENESVNQPVPDIGWGDYAQSAFKEAYLNNTSYSLAAKVMGSGSPVYNVSQLQTLYPDVPADHWKGSANAFQAEVLYDRYKAADERKQLYDLVTDISDPNKGLAADAIGATAGLGAGLADPLNLAAYAVGGQIAIKAGIQMSKVAPTFMAAVGSSRLAATVGNEVMQNLATEVAITYPIQKGITNEYDQQDRTFLDTVKNSIGTALAFGAIRHFGSNIKFNLKDIGGEFADKVRENNFFKRKDSVNAASNSESANTATTHEASFRELVAPFDADPHSSTERMAKSVFNKDNTPEFSTEKAPFYGLYEKKSGTSDYTGNRYGDLHTFSSSPEAVQGMYDTYAKDGNKYEIYGHKGNLKLIDLDNTPANDHPDILDIVGNEVGNSIWRGLKDDASLSDVFNKVLDSSNAEGASGKDINAMFKDIHAYLEKEGYQGTLHKELQGNTKHDVMSVFDNEMKAEDLIKVHEGTSNKPSVVDTEPESNIRTDGDVKTVTGEVLPAEEKLPSDPLYDNDPEVMRELAKYVEPEYILKSQEYKNTKIEDIDIGKEIQPLLMDLNESMRQKPENDYSTLEERTKAIQEEFKNNPPEKEDEIAKAIENCLRKG